MKKDDWASIESDLLAFNTVNFEIDGHKIQVQLQTYKLKFIFGVYIDGMMKGAWIKELGKSSAIAEKVWFHKTKRLYKKSDILKLSKVLGKKGLKKRDIKEVSTWIVPHFDSFRTLKSSWTKNIGLENINYIK